MRWQKKQKSVTDYKKIVKRFALFPICVNNEWRWLETCYILKTRWIDWGESGWTNTAWVSENAYLIWKQGAKYCDEDKCKYCIDGAICALQYNATIDAYGICRSMERK